MRALVGQGQSEDAQTSSRRAACCWFEGGRGRRQPPVDTGGQTLATVSGQATKAGCSRAGEGAGRQALGLRAVGSRGREKHAQ